MTDTQLLELIRAERLADLGDGMDALGLVNLGSMSSEMRPIRPGIKFAGFAFTVKLVPAQRTAKACASVDEYLSELGKWCAETYSFMEPLLRDAKNKVAVIDMGGIPGGIWGSENGMATMKAGLEGAVIDGACRDSEECNLEKVKVFCTRRTFNHVYGRLQSGGINVPVQCAGVTVQPGDIVCADDDGVLVIPRARAAEVLVYSQRQHLDDQKTRAKHYRDLGYKPDATLGDAR